MKRIRNVKFRILTILVVITAIPVSACAVRGSDTASDAAATKPGTVNSPASNDGAVYLIPQAAEYEKHPGSYTLTADTTICVTGDDEKEIQETAQVGEYLASLISPSTGYEPEVVKSISPSGGGILLTAKDDGKVSDAGGYRIKVTEQNITLSADNPEGLFHGVQTLRQLLPAEIEKDSLTGGVDWTIDCAAIIDYPVYRWRGMMLDTARNFISVENVKRMIDLMAGYKMNTLHLHLSDDQGWRIEIKSWPELAAIGGSSAADGGTGGYYTQEQYADIVEYAQSRYITVVPEIDMPGHTNAALASYGELNPDGRKAKPYTGTDVGFSTLMCNEEITYAFIDDVIRELAALTPGEYIHVGGDEASSTSKEDYNTFMTRVNEIAASYGKKTIGWNPFDQAEGTSSESLLQCWQPDVSAALQKGMKLVISPPDKAYLDMKYHENTALGLQWAGYIPTDVSYCWNPTDYAPEGSIEGVECPLWSETIRTMEDLEFLAFPRLLSHAEIGWTQKDLRNWDDYKHRLAGHAIRMDYQKIGYYKDPSVSWIQ